MLKWSEISHLTTSHQEKELQARYIFPFFNRWLRVVVLMVDTADKKSHFFRPVYFQHDRVHTFISHQRLREITPASLIALLKDAYHFDPWWAIQQVTDIPAELIETVKKTNIAGRKLKGRRIIDICFNDSLTLLEGIRVNRAFLGSELINQGRLFPLVFEK